MLSVLTLVLSACGPNLESPEAKPGLSGDVQIEPGPAPADDSQELGSLELPLAGAASPELAKTELTRVNRHRAAHVSRGPLSMRECLRQRAEQHSRYMASQNLLFHTENLGNKVTNDCPAVKWRMVGENVGVGGAELDIFNAFLGSASHHENIDRANWNQMGIGVYVKDGKVWITQIYADWL
jgi:uncharacterized protein YkwD